MTKRKITYRGYTAEKPLQEIRIYDWNGDLVCRELEPKYGGSNEMQMRTAIDRFISIAPYIKAGFYGDGQGKVAML